jgi:hypothetical protein
MRECNKAAGRRAWYFISILDIADPVLRKQDKIDAPALR